MAESYDVAIKVISQKGTCYAGHQVGDEWVIRSKNHKTPRGVCLFAFSSLYPLAKVLMYGGSFPWSTDPDITTVACVDAENPVVFELRRLRK
ncbi:MAG: TIGR04076 family protein [Dehalococcoidia bacterium]|nr:MAG: TIGR04076 family protein [Dehalococcoidia bacterium]